MGLMGCVTNASMTNASVSICEGSKARSACAPRFFHPKPGQFHVDSGNLNFITIC